jgi:resuscitation-promoting factor RpfB
VTEFRPIPFNQVTVKDATLARGKTEIRTRGARGTKRLTFELMYAGGKQVSKRLLRTEVTKRPVTQVRAVGTKVEQPEPSGGGCDPNYTGCVPIASDVDCAGGSGNGPAYVAGPVQVVGTDVYGLDRDKDGVACED